MTNPIYDKIVAELRIDPTTKAVLPKVTPYDQIPKRIKHRLAVQAELVLVRAGLVTPKEKNNAGSVPPRPSNQSRSLSTSR